LISILTGLRSGGNSPSAPLSHGRFPRPEFAGPVGDDALSGIVENEEDHECAAKNATNHSQREWQSVLWTVARLS
jgi:hypothetical protein